MGYQRASNAIASDNIEPVSYKLDHQTTDLAQVQYDGRYLHNDNQQPSITANYDNFQASLDTPLKPAERYLLAKARSATAYAQQQQPIPTIPNKSKASRNRSQARAARNAHRDRARSYLYDSPNKDLSSSISELSSNVSSPSSAAEKDNDCNNQPQTPEVPRPQSIESGDTSGHETKAVRRKKYKPRHRDSTLNKSLTSVIKPLPCRRSSSPNTIRSRDKLLASFDSSFNSVVSDLSIRSVDFSASMEIYFFEK